MRSEWRLIPAALCCAVLLTSCKAPSEEAVRPMLGLDWFREFETVKADMNSYRLLAERESGDQQPAQKMLDYAGVTLFDQTCDLTLCFTDSGLIGFNYHDTERTQAYRGWMRTLEDQYGLPTEEGSGMASWYDNPLGKDTAVYLFNLAEGVQVSFYATADSPDKTYKKQKQSHVPTPELRTPVVPVAADTPAVTATADSSAESAPVTKAGKYRVGEQYAVGTDAAETTTGTAAETDSDGNPVASETAETTAVSEKTEQKADQSRAFLPDGVSFYCTPDAGRRSMERYQQAYEYRTAEPGQPWELIMEYRNVPYLEKSCDGVLCFTSRGLVGISYFDNSTDSYMYWVKQLTAIYGAPDETQYDYSAWTAQPVGNGTSVYVFSMEDGVQISFFTDDAGSEIA